MLGLLYSICVIVFGGLLDYDREPARRDDVDGGWRSTSRRRVDEDTYYRRMDDRTGGAAAEFSEGMLVRARYRGVGQFYDATVKHVNADDTLDIVYDDGEVYLGLKCGEAIPIKT